MNQGESVLFGFYVNLGGEYSGTYIARYVKVHKNLSIQPNKTIVVGNYNSANAPANVMGWYGNTKTIGFSATPTSNYIADGVTRDST